MSWLIDLARLAVGFLLLSRVPRPGRWGRARSDVAVIIPARNEAESLPRLLEGLLPQLRNGDELVVVDDESEDGTARLAEEAGARVVRAGELPNGWTGKSRACHLGVEATHAPVLVFLDADVRFDEPGTLQAVVAELDDRGGLVSVQPGHDPVGAGEQMAAFFNLVSMMGTGAFMPFGPVPKVAFGPVLACRREDYRKAGGHEAVAAEVLDDAALAERFRSIDLPVRLMGGGKALTFRMYPQGIPQMVEGFTKNFAAGARRTNPLVMAAVVFWLSGAIAAPFRGWLRYGLYAGQIAALLPRVGRFRWWVPVVYPLPLTVFLGVFVRSLMSLATGRPVRWKGRLVGGRGKN